MIDAIISLNVPQALVMICHNIIHNLADDVHGKGMGYPDGHLLSRKNALGNPTIESFRELFLIGIITGVSCHCWKPEDGGIDLNKGFGAFLGVFNGPLDPYLAGSRYDMGHDAIEGANIAFGDKLPDALPRSEVLRPGHH